MFESRPGRQKAPGWSAQRGRGFLLRPWTSNPEGLNALPTIPPRGRAGTQTPGAATPARRRLAGSHPTFSPTTTHALAPIFTLPSSCRLRAQRWIFMRAKGQLALRRNHHWFHMVQLDHSLCAIRNPSQCHENDPTLHSGTRRARSYLHCHPARPGLFWGSATGGPGVTPPGGLRPAFPMPPARPPRSMPSTARTTP